MRRRAFITLARAVAGLPLAARALQSEQAPLIALLFAGTESFPAGRFEEFREGMHKLGYAEGRNVRFVTRVAGGYLERLPALAAELISLGPKVVVTEPLPASLAAHQATKTIPIVTFGADPVAFGLAESLSRPGGNVIGVAIFSESVVAKQFDIARELLPRLSRVAMLINVNNPLHVPQLREVQAAVTNAGVDLVVVEVRGPDDLEKTFATLPQRNADALLVSPDPIFLGKQIAELAAPHRLPTVYGYREPVVA